MTTEIRNAVIESVRLSFSDRGFLDCWIGLDYGGAGQGFGGFTLYLPKGFAHHAVNGPAGHFIFRVMEVAGVENWDQLKGRTVRVRADHCGVEAIGHIVKDDWFCPADDFAKATGALQAEVERLSAAPPAVGREEIARIRRDMIYLQSIDTDHRIVGYEQATDSILSALGRTEATTPPAWQPIEAAPRDGTEFQAWWKGQWQPRARFDPEYGSFQLWGRTDCDTEGWECFAIEGFWQPLPTPPEGKG